MNEKPKASKCCGEFESKNPGAGAHYPDPCKHCGWSQPDHRTAPAMTPAVQALIVALQKARRYVVERHDRGHSVACSCHAPRPETVCFDLALIEKALADLQVESPSEP